MNGVEKYSFSNIWSKITLPDIFTDILLHSGYLLYEWLPSLDLIIDFQNIAEPWK